MTDQNEDTFEVSLRILGNEIIGMRLTSASRARNWAAFGIIAMVFLLAVAGQTLPTLIEALNQ
jgi:hypothetical protein